MKMKIFAVLVIAILSGNVMATPQRPGERIFGGSLLDIDNARKHTFTVLIEAYDGTDLLIACTGNILSTAALVTTAECLYFPSALALTIRVSITGNDGTRHITDAAIWIPHESYVEATKEHNIGIIIVATPFPETPAYAPVNRPLDNWELDQFPGESLTVAGYRDPYTLDGYHMIEPTYGTFIQRSRHYCSGFFFGNYVMQSYEICGSSSDMAKVAICEADFGAGLIYYDINLEAFYLYGLASRPFPNGCFEGPTVFIFMLDYMNWVDTTIANNS